jgi:hypothetical protein
MNSNIAYPPSARTGEKLHTFRNMSTNRSSEISKHISSSKWYFNALSAIVVDVLLKEDISSNLFRPAL